jgi:hypothetical protein
MESEQLVRTFLRIARILGRKPAASPFHALPRIGFERPMPVNLNCAQRDRCRGDVAIGLRRSVIDRHPMAVGSLMKRDLACVDCGSQVGPYSCGIHREQAIAIIQRGVDNIRVLHRAIDTRRRRKPVDRIRSRQFLVHRNAVFASRAKRERGQNLVMARFAILLRVPIFLGRL